MISKFKISEKGTQLPVAVLGAGLSGRGVSALLDKLGWEYKVYDEQDRVFTREEARECSVVICSPGFKKEHSWRIISKECGKEIITETDFASNFINSRIIGITGTNGKTTVVSFLVHLWKTAGRKAIAAGNIGVPLSQIVADGITSETTVFLESSSFQSEDLKTIRPDAVLWTNFNEDHIDYHRTEKKYFIAKAKLLLLGNKENLFIGSSVIDFAKKIDFKLPPQCKVIGRNNIPDNVSKKLSFLTTYPQVENLSFSYALAQRSGVSQSVFLKAMDTYHPEPHRLQRVDSIHDATFWNDSKSTNFASALAACKNFTGNIFWIGGGKSKGGKIEEFAKHIIPLVNQAFLIGESGEILFEIFEKNGLPSVWCKSLDEAVRKAFQSVVQRTTILLSPGFASFDTFKDYIERGNSFNKIVLDLKKIASNSTHNSFA